MYAIAFELSDRFLNALRGKNDFMTCFIAKSFVQFMCNVFTESDHMPLMV